MNKIISRTLIPAALLATALTVAPASASAARKPSNFERRVVLKATGKSDRQCGGTRVAISTVSRRWAAASVSAYVDFGAGPVCQGQVVFARRVGRGRWREDGDYSAGTSSAPVRVQRELSEAVSRRSHR